MFISNDQIMDGDFRPINFNNKLYFIEGELFTDLRLGISPDERFCVYSGDKIGNSMKLTRVKSGSEAINVVDYVRRVGNLPNIHGAPRGNLHQSFEESFSLDNEVIDLDFVPIKEDLPKWLDSLLEKSFWIDKEARYFIDHEF